MWFLFSLDDEATPLLRNVENYPPKDTASQPTSTDISATPLSEAQASCRYGGVAGGGEWPPRTAQSKEGQQTGQQNEQFKWKFLFYALNIF